MFAQLCPQTITDKVFGLSLLAAAAVIFIYYTLWVVVTPFVDADHPLQQYFPERQWAIILPTGAFICVVAAAGTFIGLVMIKSKKRR